MLFGNSARCEFMLALALIIGLALLAFLPIPAQAQGPVIELELGDDGATTWNMNRVKPGDSGTRSVELHNAGSRNGSVTVWISAIEQMDYDSDGAVLDDYLLLGLSCDRLISAIDLPTTVHCFPKAASDRSLVVTPLNAGEMITLVWEWEFPETGKPQNDAQGDSFSFTVNYLLEESLPGGGGWGGGWGGGGYGGEVPPAPQSGWLAVDLWGTVVLANLTDEGVVTETIEATSADGALTLRLYQGTKVLDCSGNRLSLIEVETVIPTKPPPGACVIAGGYSFRPCCTFDPPVEVIMHYDNDTEALGDGVTEQDLAIAYYDKDDQEWLILPSVVDAEAHTVAASVDHFSMLAIIAPLSEVTPTPTTSPEATPAPAPMTLPEMTESPTATRASGLGAGAWAGIGVGALLVGGTSIWLLRRGQ